MDLQGRKYLIKDNSVLLKEYDDVKQAQANIDYNFQNSLNSNAFQSSNKLPPYQENNKSNNNFFNSNTNMNYPVQNFEYSQNPMNSSNGNGFKTFPKQNEINEMNGTQKQPFSKTYNQEQIINMQNTNQKWQLNEESKKQLDLEVEKLYDYYYLTKGYFQNDPEILFMFFLDFRKKHEKNHKVPTRLQNLMLYRNEDIEQSIYEFLQNVKDRFKNSIASTAQNSKCKRSISVKKGFETTIKNTYDKKFT